jgi:hypothetical protein
MGDNEGFQKPGFLHGSEVARPVETQPAFDEQLPLPGREQSLKKKLEVALIVIFSVFLAGMAAGAAVGYFI